VISLPSGVFKPYAGVSTAIIVFSKGGTTEACSSTTCSRTATRSTTSARRRAARMAGSGRPEERPVRALERFEKRNAKKDTDRTAKHFVVPKADIVAKDYDLSINRYKETKHEAVTYDPPKVIIARLRALEAEIAKELRGSWRGCCDGDASHWGPRGADSRCDLRERRCLRPADVQGVPVLRAGNIQEGRVLFDDLVYVPRERKISREQYLKLGDVLIATSSGSLDVVGRRRKWTAECEAGFGAFCKVLSLELTLIPAISPTGSRLQPTGGESPAWRQVQISTTSATSISMILRFQCQVFR
jgi:hypothetical protein